MSDIQIIKEEVLQLVQLCRPGVDIKPDQLTALCATMVHLGAFHGVGSWCYYQIKQQGIDIQENTVGEWKQRYLFTTIQNQQKLKVYQEIAELLGKQGISVLGLKGIALGHLVYEDEGLRQMGDVDILVPDGKGIEALHVLLSAGAEAMYEPRSSIHEQVHAHVRAIKYKGVMVEIHQRLFHLGSKFNMAIDFEKDRQHHRIPMGQIESLSPVLFTYHLIAHTAYNYKMGGLRLSWLLDMALMLKKQDSPLAFVHKVLLVNPKVKSALLDVLKMVSILLPEIQPLFDEEYDMENALDTIYDGVLIKNMSHKHQLINMGDIIRTPGILRKAHLLYREFFPTASYMHYRYNSTDSLLKLYFKRLVNSRM